MSTAGRMEFIDQDREARRVTLSQRELLDLLVRGMTGYGGYGVPRQVWDVIRHLIVQEAPTHFNEFCNLVQKHNLACDADGECIHYTVDDVEQALRVLELS